MKEMQLLEESFSLMPIRLIQYDREDEPDNEKPIYNRVLEEKQLQY
jgi:hypothetical protein